VAGLAVGLYLATLGHGFVYDDGVEVVDNTRVHGWSHVGEVFTSTAWTGALKGGGHDPPPLYRPLTSLTYVVNYSLTGLQPWSYHLLNVLLHALCSLLVYWLARVWRAPAEVALAAGLIFAAHPIHVEVVANVCGRKDLLVACGLLGAVGCHRLALLGTWRWGVGAWLALLAALFSKEIGVVGVGLILVQDLAFWRETRPRLRRALTLYSAYAVATAGFLLARWQVVGGLGLSEVAYRDNPLAHEGSVVRLLTAVKVLGLGLGLQVLPVRLSPDYSPWAIELVRSATDPLFLVSLLALAALVVLPLLLWRRSPWGLLLLSLYALPLVLTANLLFPIGAVFGERFLHLSNAASCLLLGLGFGALRARWKPYLAWGVLVIVLVFFGLGTVRYALVWKSDYTLFAHAAKVRPGSHRLQEKWGEVLNQAGDTEAAIAAYQRSLAIIPDNYLARLKLALLLDRSDRRIEAEALFEELVRGAPNNTAVLYSLATQRRDRQRLQEAEVLWRRVLSIDPRHAGALSDLGGLLTSRGQHPQARQVLERAVAADPKMASAWYNLALACSQQGDLVRQRQALTRFVATAGPEYAPQVARARQRLQVLGQ
jgi:tetratricopeptide (TPR) repeat protein